MKLLIAALVLASASASAHAQALDGEPVPGIPGAVYIGEKFKFPVGDLFKEKPTPPDPAEVKARANCVMEGVVAAAGNRELMSIYANNCMIAAGFPRR